MSTTISLTGDLELDVMVPHRPRVLPEITWIPLSATKVLAAGSLNATILPSRLGGTSLFTVLHKLDGSNDLENIAGGQSQIQQEMRRFLRLLFQAGLIEDGSNPVIPEGSGFYALTMDQTRLHQNRKDALASGQRAVRMIGISPSMLKMFRQVGINLDDASASMLPAFQILMLNPAGCPMGEGSVIDDVPVLPIRLHGGAIDVGPWLSPKAGCELADLQAHIIQEASNRAVTGNVELLEAFCAHSITLLLAGISPFAMASTLYRVHCSDSGPHCERIAISRLANQLPNATAVLRKKLLDRAESAMPAMRHVGTKSYEAHYLPHNLMAAFEIQESGYKPVATLPGALAKASSRILNVLLSAFGCKLLDSGRIHRNCPSGGNLGSPEPLLWCNTAGILYVYRYIPLLNQLECVLKTEAGNETPDEVGILCLGNQEKMQRKYGRFGETLACLDGGVARSFFEAAAKVECIDLQPLLPEVETPAAVNQLVTDRQHYYTQLWAFKLQPSPEWRVKMPDKLVERIRFAEIIKTRRSARSFSHAGVPLEGYARLVHASRAGIFQETGKISLSCIRPILRVREVDRQHFYLMDDNGVPHHLCSKNSVPELFLQKNIDNAPLALFLTADLSSFLEHRDEKELDALIAICGQWLGTLWLSLSSSGIGGCPCGAAVEMDLQAVLPPGYRDYSLLASFVSGTPAS